MTQTPILVVNHIQLHIIIMTTYDLNYLFLKNRLTPYKVPTEELLHTLLEHSRVKSYEPREVLLRAGDIHTKIVLIQEGKVLAYEKVKDRKYLDWIWGPNDFIINPSNSLRERVSDVEIVSPVASTTLEIDLKKLYSLREHFRELDFYFSQFLAEKNGKLKAHIRGLKRSNSKERLSRFKEEHKDIYYIIPDEQKARYLGMGLRWLQKNK